MTLKEAKAQVRLVGCTLTKRDGEYRVNFKDGKEATAYYTDGEGALEDAVRTAQAMAKLKMSAPGGTKIFEAVLELAREHGEVSDPDHEVGDLQDALRAAWHWLNPLQQEAVLVKMCEAAKSWKS